MTKENDSISAHLETVIVDLRTSAVEIQAEGGTRLRFTYTPRGVLMQLTLGTTAAPLVSDDVVGPPLTDDSADAPTQTSAAPKAKSPAEVLSGKLQTKPAQGRPDGRGNPTAWARFLAHREDHDGAVLISATFHNRTTSIALGLDAGDGITAQGYYHPNRDPQRLATFSIFHLMNYPGKRAVDADNGPHPIRSGLS